MLGPQTVRVRSGGEGTEASPGKAGGWVFRQQFFLAQIYGGRTGLSVLRRPPCQEVWSGGRSERGRQGCGSAWQVRGLPLGVRGQSVGSQHHHPLPFCLGRGVHPFTAPHLENCAKDQTLLVGFLGDSMKPSE